MGKVNLAGKLEDARSRVESEGSPDDRGVAKFARMTRKDARVRPDQDVALTALVKTVMHRRAVKVERITENTLIRIAIDLLLTHAAELRGSTEDELRESVTPALPASRIADVTGSRAAGLTNSGIPQLPSFPVSVPGSASATGTRDR